MKTGRKLVVPAVLVVVVLGTTALLAPSCGDDDGPRADAQSSDGQPNDGGQPDMPLV